MPALTRYLHEANARLAPWIESLVSTPACPFIARPENLNSILSELLQTGAMLRSAPLPLPGADRELELELSRYRRHVERLRSMLPSIQRQLLLERSCLEAQRSRVNAAAAWARASRQTLERS